VQSCSTRVDGQTDTTKLIVAFRNFAITQKILRGILCGSHNKQLIFPYTTLT